MLQTRDQTIMARGNLRRWRQLALLTFFSVQSMVQLADAAAVPGVTVAGLNTITVVNSAGNTFSLVFSNDGDNVGFLPFVDVGEFTVPPLAAMKMPLSQIHDDEFSLSLSREHQALEQRNRQLSHGFDPDLFSQINGFMPKACFGSGSGAIPSVAAVEDARLR